MWRIISGKEWSRIFFFFFSLIETRLINWRCNELFNLSLQKVDVIFSELLLSLTKNVSDKSSFEEDWNDLRASTREELIKTICRFWYYFYLKYRSKRKWDILSQIQIENTSRRKINENKEFNAGERSINMIKGQSWLMNS